MGKIVNTGDVKINIGGEWWVDMTPQEGEAWVRRRKAGKLRLSCLEMRVELTRM